MRKLYYHLHVQVLQWLRDARKDISSDCQTPLQLKREGRWRSGLCLWFGHGRAVRKTAFAPPACCPVDRLKLVPATDHHSCYTLNLEEMLGSLHNVLPTLQREIIETRVSKSCEFDNAKYTTVKISSSTSK